jgi:hypothetical protein
VASCHSYVCNTDDVKYDRVGKGYPKNFAVTGNYHYDLEHCYLLSTCDLDYRILSARDGWYYMGDRNWSYCTLLEIQNGYDCLMRHKRGKLVETLLILGLNGVNDADKVRYVHGFSESNQTQP